MKTSENSGAVTQQPIAIVTSTKFGSEPTSLACNICMNKITTVVDYRKGAVTWLACSGIALIGGIFGCCLLPFYTNTCRDAYHTCPECGTLLGVYKRI